MEDDTHDLDTGDRKFSRRCLNSPNLHSDASVTVITYDQFLSIAVKPAAKSVSFTIDLT
jgi:hypothetical protein